MESLDSFSIRNLATIPPQFKSATVTKGRLPRTRQLNRFLNLTLLFLASKALSVKLSVSTLIYHRPSAVQRKPKFSGDNFRTFINSLLVDKSVSVEITVSVTKFSD